MNIPSISEICSLSYEEVLSHLQTRLTGLTNAEVLERQKIYGKNIIHTRQIEWFRILLRQLTDNPLLLILIAATVISFFLGQTISSYYIFGLIFVSILLGFWNEYSAEQTVNTLLKKISPTAVVEREEVKEEIPVARLTIGDIVLLSEGNIIPAELRIIESKNLEVNESALTGESKTVYKIAASISSPHAITDMTNIAFMGTSIESGSGKGIVVAIGKNTEFGKIAKATMYAKPSTDFEKGLENFGKLLVKIIILMTLGIFIGNTLLKHSFLDSLLFSLAIAIGLTPELLPVIVTVSLSHGAGKLARKKVVAKQLIAIENLGNMDILCTDKTGTLTEGDITLIDMFDHTGKKNQQIFPFALWCNSAIFHHKIIGSGIDAAIWKYAQKNHIHPDLSVEKIDEEPFNFEKKAMFSVISKNGKVTLIAKGATANILCLCHPFANKKEIEKEIEKLNSEGLRVVVIAKKEIEKKKEYTWEDVKDLTFTGFITFLDVPKVSAKEALERLGKLHVLVKVITGDNEVVSQKVCQEVGMDIEHMLLGSEIDKLSDEEFAKKVVDTTLFARVTPTQKLRIIKTLQKIGHVVGFLGDGINDAPSLHGADVGISVNSAVDVAKEAASIVLLRKSLDVIAEGITEGRRTFANTIKYILMSTSSNFGNMFSAAGASFFLPFLPMTPLQILLTNGLYDISQLSIPTDNVDAESLVKPRKWDIRFIRDYMVFFGPLSSLYDYITFGILIYFFHARNALFQTGWFIESLATEILVVFVIRTARMPFFLSKPGKWLILTSFVMVGIGILLPFTPLGSTLSFVTPPPLYFLILVILVSTYLLFVELIKKIFLKKYNL